MNAPEAPKEGKKDKEKDLKIKIHNEDDGENSHFEARPHDTLGSVIDKFYAEDLDRGRREDDRLRCKRGEEDIFGFADLTFRRYLDQGHCPELHWLFAGGTGGA
jgi:hypothetical protein